LGFPAEPAVPRGPYQVTMIGSLGFGLTKNWNRAKIAVRLPESETTAGPPRVALATAPARMPSGGAGRSRVADPLAFVPLSGRKAAT
jgi:hypothetical protein